MPFQAIPIALRQNPGSPLEKLLLVFLVNVADLQAETADALAYCDPDRAAAFCQCSPEEIIEALKALQLKGFVLPYEGIDPRDKWLFVTLSLPMTSQPDERRKRIKCTPDQIDQLALRDGGHRCCGCGNHGEPEDEWHVDHIIPRSVGGADVEANVQLLCPKCNSRKGARVHWVDFLK